MPGTLSTIYSEQLRIDTCKAGADKRYVSLVHTDDDVAATIDAFQHVAEAVAADLPTVV